MWYLQTDILLRLLIACGAVMLVSGISRLIFKKDLAPKVLIFASMAVIAYVSAPLALFYAGYTVVTFLLARILGRIKKTGVRRFFFVFFCFLCISPFLYGRLVTSFPQLPVIITLVGIAYQMLKAVDAMYFVYYADVKIPFLTYANYILFFPTLTSGPIFRYRDFKKVFDKPVPLTTDRFIMCVKRFIRGMFKKMVVLYFVTAVFNFLIEGEYHWYISALTVILSYFLLFFDLSGYSDIAIATGTVMGFTVPENFKKPWAAASFTQFWRNWHITLSDWVREHVTVVINNRRLGRAASAAMGFSIMFIMSMWHNISLSGVAGGIYIGFWLGLENLLGLTGADKRRMNKAVYVLRCIFVNAVFALNTLFMTVSTEQFIGILKGFMRL